MFNKQTVFVLGAGISVPFGFPAGERLVRILSGMVSPHNTEDNRDLLQQHARVAEVIIRTGQTRNFVEQFAQSLKASGTPSIDTWLSQNDKYIEVGKIGIATVIADAESRAREHSYAADDWYRWLFDRMLRNTSSLAEFRKNKVSFISFNYDRMLEWRLGQYIEHFFGRSTDGERIAAIDDFYGRIVHVHGHLSFSDYLSLRDNFGDVSLPALAAEPVAAEKLKDFATKAFAYSRTVKIIGEPFGEGHEYAFTSLIQGAERIVFLGFGYDVRNISLFRLRNKASQLMSNLPVSDLDHAILGTAYGLGGGQIQDAKAEIDAYMHLGPPTLTCVPFCNEYISVRDGALSHIPLPPG